MPTTTVLTIDGHTLIARLLNPGVPGEPIILLHGLGHSIDFWQTETVLVRYGPCYALSLPGHYPARFPAWFEPNDLTSQMFTGLLEQAIDQLVGAREVTLAGISTGGFAALALAARYPQRASRVISISGFSHGTWTGVLATAQHFTRANHFTRQLFTIRNSLNRASRRVYAYDWRNYVANFQALKQTAGFQQMIDFLYPNARRLKLNALAIYCARMPEIDITSQLSSIQVPTLVLTGDRDPLVAPSQSTTIARLIPNATLAIINGAGHFLALEKPVEYQAVLRAWLAYALNGGSKLMSLAPFAARSPCSCNGSGSTDPLGSEG